MNNNMYAFKSKSKGDFFDFISDLTGVNAKTLFDEFSSAVDKNNPIELMNWFQNKGYSISHNDCIKILENKEMVSSISNGTPVVNY